MAIKNKDSNSTWSRLRYLDKQLANPNLSQKEIKILKMREQNLLDMLEDGQETFRKGGKVATPKTKTQAFADYKKKHGRHHKADPRHPMNSERTGPSTIKKMAGGGKLNALQKRKIANDKALASGFMNLTKEEREKEKARLARKKAGGKLKMVEKGGKKVPFYAADGVGKMAKGGPVTVEKGMTLSQIAKDKGISLKALLSANPNIKNANQIRIGQKIKVPGAEAGKAAKTGNPYKGMSRVQMTDMDVKNKSEKRQRRATRSMQTQAKMGTGMTPTSKESKKKIEDRSGRTHFNKVKERVMGNRSKTNAKPKKARPAIPSNDIAAKKGGVMKAKGYKHGGKMCRGGGAATRGKSYGKAG